MSEPRQETLIIKGTEVTVAYKDVKHLHLSVHPPAGAIRAVVPLTTAAEQVRLFVVSQLGWARRKQRMMQQRDRPLPAEYTQGETVYLWGKAYRIRLHGTMGRHRVEMTGDYLDLYVRSGTDRAGRERTLRRFYREEIQKALPRIYRRWEKKTGLVAEDYRIKWMATKWGSCNAEARRIWVNLELAKHPPAALSYIVLHELLHLAERGHTPAFKSLLTKYLPVWRAVRDELNTGLVGVPELPG